MDRTPIVLVSLVLVFTACAGANEPRSGSRLEGGTWIMDRPSVERLEPDAPPEARATIRFDGDGGGIGGSAFCNLYGGEYRAEDDSITIEVGAMTEMACPEPVMSMESAFVAFLGSVRTYRVEGDRLTLAGDELELTFDAEPPEPLVGTTWRVDGLIDGDVVSSTIAGTRPYLVLDQDGGVSGDAGCDGLIGTYEVDGDGLTFASLESSERCDDPAVAAQEAAILRALSATAGYEIEGATLSLLDAGGRLVLTLVAG
jgi:heat shock protein HslJ